MSKFKLYINQFAENDLDSSKNYYKNKKNGLEKEFLLELKKTIKRIQENPYQFPKIEKEARKANLKRFPFAIFFIEESLIINVFSIFNFSRNPEIWKERIKD